MDSLAKMISENDHNIQLFEEVPQYLLHLLEYDIGSNAFGSV